MLYPAENQPPKAPAPATKASSKTTIQPMEQASIGQSLLIKGEVIGSEPLYIDGHIEGSIHLAGNRLTIGHHGSVIANLDAEEVIIMGSVKGNVQCSERLEIRSEGSLVGDVVSQRISIEDGAVLRGSVEVRTGAQKRDKDAHHTQAKATPGESEKSKAAAAGAGS